MNINKKSNHCEDVTLLITHYNRSKSLERLLEHFNVLNTSFEEIIVSDDGSQKEHLDYIENLKNKYNFRLITTPQNKGLGNNINKGQDAVRTDYTLYVQEDFIPLKSFDTHFKDAFSIISKDISIDTIRFYSYLDYPELKTYDKGFSEMVFRPWSTNLDKFTMYSDHPHLKRSSFSEKFGRYAENKNPEKTEFDMMISYLQCKGKGLLFIDYKSVFEQINTDSEPSTMKRKFWRYSNNYFISMAKFCYRQFIFNYSLFFKKY